MDLENDKNEMVMELDIIYKPTKIPLHVIQYPLRDQEAPFENFLSLTDMKMKPIQKKLEFIYKTEKKFENASKNLKTQDDIKIKYSSKFVNNRTNYWAGVLDSNTNKILFFPVDSFYQMRKSFEDFHVSNKLDFPAKVKNEKIPAKEEKKINKREKPLEQKLKNYTFQKEILESEKALDVDFYSKNSYQSTDFLKKLLTIPKNIKTLNPQTKEEFLKNIIEK